MAEELDDFTVETTGEIPAPPPEPVKEPLPTSPRHPVEEPAEELEPERAAKPTNGKPRESVQARIDAAVRAQREAERRADEALARARDLEAKIHGRQEPERPTQPDYDGTDASDPEPQFESFANEADPYRAFIAAQARWNTRAENRKIDRMRADQQRVETVQRVERERAQTFQKRIREQIKQEPAEFLASLPQAVLDLRPSHALGPDDALTGANAIADEFLDSDVGPKLMQHFADHPADLQRIATLHPIAAIRELAILGHTLRPDAAKDTASASAAPVISKAKPPLKTVGSSPVVRDDEPPDSDDVDLDKHIRWHNARDPRINPKAARSH